jgi:3-hydroxyacyl-CoA dehydrogenase
MMLTIQRHDDILDLILANPPVNALSVPLRRDLLEAITEAQRDPGVRAIVLRGAGKLFSAGADIAEFDLASAEPLLPEVVDAIERSDKPTFAVIHGMALGGALEIALGCHYRIATKSTQLGLPEVKLGLLPGAGGTQRLPRLVGIETALEIILSGEPLTAARAVDIGLIDLSTSEHDLVNRAMAFARDHLTVRRTKERAVAAQAGAIAKFISSRSRLIEGSDAAVAALEAVMCSTELPFEGGMKQEAALFSRLLASPQSKALRHIFTAERVAAKLDGAVHGAKRRPIERVGVIGGGTMGSGISATFLLAGFSVTLVEEARKALDRGVESVEKVIASSVNRGKLSQEDGQEALGRLAGTLNFGMLQDCDLIIEAVYEDMDIKKKLFRQIQQVAKSGAIIASNTSFLSIDDMAAATDRSEDVLGLHFFSPAHLMKLVEVVRGERTAPDVLATVVDLARKIKKVPVAARVCYGFIGNRMLIPRQYNAIALLLEGATPEQVDQVHTRLGLPMGPFQMADLAGIDIGWHRDPTRIDSVTDALCAAGRWGQKTGAGYYDYDDNRRRVQSPIAESIVTEFRARSGISPRTIADEEIMARTIYTIINEGAKILEEGIAQRASDIDVVWVYGYGWPARTGGPMYWASQIGLRRILESLQHYKDRMLPGFEVSSLLTRLAAEDVGFEG